MSDVISLAEARAAKEEDSTLWTPLDMARALVRDIESGEINPDQISVQYLYENPEGDRAHGFYAAGLNYLEHVGLLNIALAGVMKSWIR
jgi:hypothetical protein